MKRADVNRDWLYDRCREVEASPNGHLDLWSREHYKSTIITFALTIQDILRDKDTTIGIFSHTRPIAKAFLAQIKRELEGNGFLKSLFKDVLYENPAKESPKWSLDEGIIVCRRTNPKESTVEAWGLVDGQPTSKHYLIMIYDDVVVRESVSTPEMIAKTTEAWATSLNLTDTERGVMRCIGTRWHSNDTYATMIERGSFKERRYPATSDGTFAGKPVLWTQEKFDKKVSDMETYVASAQLLQNPLADAAMGFKTEWLQYYDTLRKSQKWNFYLICDPATEKRRDNDFTSMWVIGCAPDGNYYLVDGLRDRINLTERCLHLFRLHRLWRPLVTGYEKYGLQSDIQHIRYVQEQEGYRFSIVELGGSTPKNDRIKRLEPLFRNRRMWMPRALNCVSSEGKVYDLIRSFVNDEFLTFPVGRHDDMLDCLARVCDADMRVQFPKVTSDVDLALPVSTLESEYDPLVINNGKQQRRGRTNPVNRVLSWREIMTRN